MFKLSISNFVTFPVRGSVGDENGKSTPFSFSITAQRTSQSDLSQFLAELSKSAAGETTDFLAGRINGWSGVQDAQGAELPFSEAALRELLNIVGVAGLVLGAYVEACSAKGKEKN